MPGRRRNKADKATATESTIVENTVSEESVVEQQTQEQEENSITINDLYAATQIIDAATRRGAFSASEVAGVGATYTKIVDFLKVSAPQLFEKQGEANE